MPQPGAFLEPPRTFTHAVDSEIVTIDHLEIDPGDSGMVIVENSGRDIVQLIGLLENDGMIDHVFLEIQLSDCLYTQ